MKPIDKEVIKHLPDWDTDAKMSYVYKAYSEMEEIRKIISNISIMIGNRDKIDYTSREVVNNLHSVLVDMNKISPRLGSIQTKDNIKEFYVEFLSMIIVSLTDELKELLDLGSEILGNKEEREEIEKSVYVPYEYYMKKYNEDIKQVVDHTDTTRI